MTHRITPIGPLGAPAAAQGVVQSVAAQQRAVKAQVDVLGGANNDAVQSSVQKRQDAENRKKTSKLIDRKITTATLAALEPVGHAHDEDEQDAERSQDVFGKDFPYPSFAPPKPPRQGPKK